MRESDIEAYFTRRVANYGGEVRKLKWLGRNKAPDRVALFPFQLVYRVPDGGMGMRSATLWVEFKSPAAMKTFPANAHERAQAREHERMRQMGQHVLVLGTTEQVDEVLPP